MQFSSKGSEKKWTWKFSFSLQTTSASPDVYNAISQTGAGLSLTCFPSTASLWSLLTMTLLSQLWNTPTLLCRSRQKTTMPLTCSFKLSGSKCKSTRGNNLKKNPGSFAHFQWASRRSRNAIVSENTIPLYDQSLEQQRCVCLPRHFPVRLGRYRFRIRRV